MGETQTGAWEITTRSAEDTRALGERLGWLLQEGDVVCLSGTLGAGKTVLAQGIGLGLEVIDPVCSPTFALVQQNAGRLPLWHLDTYRVASLDELVDLGWDDLLRSGGVVLVEWPERIAPALPPERLEIALEYDEGDSRRLRFTPHGERMDGVVSDLRAGQQ